MDQIALYGKSTVEGNSLKPVIYATAEKLKKPARLVDIVL
jgi:hypothetical protein